MARATTPTPVPACLPYGPEAWRAEGGQCERGNAGTGRIQTVASGARRVALASLSILRHDESK